MREIQIDCPHCGMMQGAKVTCMVASKDFEASVFATCRKCYKGVVLYVTSAVGFVVDQTILGDHISNDIWTRARIVGMAPKPAEPRLVDSLPKTVASAFRDGEDEMARKKFRSAVGSYRTALERALRTIDPDLEGRLGQSGTRRANLNNKIQAIQKDKLLPQSLIDLAHSVRAFGNEIHEEEDPDEIQATLASDCAHLLLLYLFELPEKLKAATASLKKDTVPKDIVQE